jgi:hypothetical protein
MRSVKAAKAALTFSLSLLLTVLVWAGPYQELDKRLEAAHTPQEVRAVLKSATIDDTGLNLQIERYLNTFSDPKKSRADKERDQLLPGIRDWISLGARTESVPVDNSAQAMAQQIKTSPLYRDEGVAQSNWLSRAMQSFLNWLEGLFNHVPKPNGVGSAPSVLGPWVTWVMWGILGGLVIFLIVLALMHVRWKLTLKRKSKALLEEDEPERTLDEWLERANDLEAQGLYREAVRCLYLACLLRFDEARVARFDRGQTNWEHLHRIQASPKLPPGLDFLKPTQAFDRIWYGMQTKGQADVAKFREWYSLVAGSLMEKAA